MAAAEEEEVEEAVVVSKEVVETEVTGDHFDRSNDGAGEGDLGSHPVHLGGGSAASTSHSGRSAGISCSWCWKCTWRRRRIGARGGGVGEVATRGGVGVGEVALAAGVE